MRRRQERGFSLLEVLVTIAILGVLVLLAAPAAGKIIRRANDVAAYASIRQVLASARLQAVKRQANVVVLISLDPEKRIRLYTFQDRANDDTNPLPGPEAAKAANFEQDKFAGSPATDEPTLGEVILGSNVRLRKFGGMPDDYSPPPADLTAVAFDKYNGDPLLTDRIAFTPSGGIVPPEASLPPTPPGGRGIYFADVNGRNFFRVTVDSDVSGKLRIDKYVPGNEYVTSGWVWE